MSTQPVHARGIAGFEVGEAGQPPSVTTTVPEPRGVCGEQSTTPARETRVVRPTAGGPMLVQGPVRIETPDGRVVESDRFVVAICTCRRSKTYPLCDTSHRRRRRSAEKSAGPPGDRGPADLALEDRTP